MEEKVLFGNLTVYRERGAYLRRLEQFEKSKAAYDQAFLTDPDNVNLLIGRSRVCSDAVQPLQAFNDAHLALQLKPSNMLAKKMQANAMYSMSDFEDSLVRYHRGYRQRRQPPYFLEGINQGKETVQDCIGVNAGQVMLDFLPLIKKMEAETAVSVVDRKPRHVSRIPKLEAKKKLTQLQARKLQVLSRVLAMKYLGTLAYDKFFIQDLLNASATRLMSANKEGNRKILELFEKGLSSLSKRQEMLRTQRPYYSIKLAEKADSRYQSRYKEAIIKKEIEITTRTAEKMICEVEKMVRRKRINEVIALAERMQIFLDKKTPYNLPDKNVFLDRLYRAVGIGYLSQYRLSYTLSEGSNCRRIAFLMGLPVGRPKSFDSVLATYPYKFENVQLATDRIMETLEMCENSTQRCWLYYELARLLCAQKNYSLAKYYCKRCQREAEDLGNHVWWVNGSLVLMSLDIQQGNTNEVRVQIEEALHYHVKNLQDPEIVESFLKKCAEMVSQTPPADEQKAIQQRERQILSVMHEVERVDTGVLLKRMTTVPQGRRFTVIPVKLRDDKLSVRRIRKQKGLTVVPGPPPELPPAPRSKVPGLQKFDI